jgi:lipopolysaccharide export system protein LptA
MLFSNRVYFNKEKKNFLATEKPVMVIVQEADSIYIAADTIYSGIMKELPLIKGSYIKAFDTVKTSSEVKADSVLLKDSILNTKDTFSVHLTDSIPLNRKDSIKISPPIEPKIETQVINKKDSVATTNPVIKNKNKPAILLKDTNQVVQKDSLLITDKVILKKRSKEETDTMRFITAFRHVRIFNDSLQAVGDSLFYSGVDSVFELYHDPIAWSKGSQITGDTILIYTQNKKPKQLSVFENGLMIQNIKDTVEFFNQLRGRTINGFFVDGNLDYVTAKGTAESIYYAQDDDSAFVGMNRTTADRIDLFFENKNAKKIKFTNAVKGTTFPIHQLPDEKKKLPGFQWLESKRPKSKLDLFL